MTASWARKAALPHAACVGQALLLIASIGIGMLSASGALAAQTPKGLTLDSFGRDTPSCREWSDGCAVCTRTEAAAAACSLPGIACQPQPITCRDNQAK